MVMAEANRCINCLDAPCVEACPLHNDIPKWLDLAARGEFLAAAEVSQATSNIPEICGRICPNGQLCEEACFLEIKHQPVAIRAIELFINEAYIRERGLTAPVVPFKTGKTVAVIGSGPAGLTCADELARRGHSVTVLEARSQPGGLLINGIPSFKLEKWVVERRLRYLQELGVEFLSDVRVGRDVTLYELETVCFDAVFIACGAQKSKRPELPGIELKGIHDPLPFLIHNSGGDRSRAERHNAKDDLTGKTITVFGGGDTAIDGARTAVRLDADRVICVYRRDEENMPGSSREVQAAKEEGVEFQFCTQPLRFLGDHQGYVKAVECIRTKLGATDAQGRRLPVPVAKSNFVLPTDYVILAFGFGVDPVQDNHGGLFLTPQGRYAIDDRNRTNHRNVWAGGDAVRRARVVASAVNDGRKAALAIHEYLTGLRNSEGRDFGTVVASKIK
jgi:glutamate synthase (NADPH/NADH) small chain